MPIILPTFVGLCSKKQHRDIAAPGALHRDMNSFEASISVSFLYTNAFSTVLSTRRDGSVAIAAYTKPLEVIEPVPQ